MSDVVKEYLEQIKADKQKKKRILAFLLALSILVASVVTWQLHLIGLTLAGEDEDETYEIGGYLAESNPDIYNLDGMQYAITTATAKYILTDTLTNSGVNLTGVSNNTSSVTGDDYRWTFEAVDADNHESSDYKIQKNGRYLVMLAANGNNGQLTLTSVADDATVFTVSRVNNNATAVNILANDVNKHINANGGEATFHYFAGWTAAGGGSNLSLSTWQVVQRYTVANDTLSPSGAAINLFDYWISSRDASDVNQEANIYNMGINRNHHLKFRKTKFATDKPINWYYNNVTPGLVSRTLTNGYPTLSGNPELMDAEAAGESLDYLFDPRYVGESNEYRSSYSKVENLLSKDENGYYVYDSAQRYAYFKESDNKFVIYNEPAVTPNGKSPFGQFFPFNTIQQGSQGTAGSNYMNHYFGLTLTTRFIQKNKGHTDIEQKKPMSFEFSGDDDVWIFIDNVLVADLGGIHDKTGVKIDFVNGEVTVFNKDGQSIQSESDISKTYFKDIFQGTNTELTSDKKTLKDNTTHTIRFFYLERGNSDSNMSLKYNLTEIPATSIYKIDQYGAPLEGVTFAAYKTNENYEYLADDDTYVTPSINCDIDDAGVITYEGKTITPRYTGITDHNGQMIFVNEDAMLYSMSELKQMLGEHFMLREIGIPDGYRLVARSGEIELSIEDSGIMECKNMYDSGCYASPNALVTSGNRLFSVVERELDGSYKSYDYYDPISGQANGMLFAVVLKRDGADYHNPGDVGLWYPVSGNDIDGYKIWHADDISANSWSVEANIKAAIEAAKTYGNDHIFTSSSSGMQLLMDNMPGNAKKYWTYMYNQLSDDERDITALNDTDVEYYVAYYYTSANNLESANADNTTRVWSRFGAVDDPRYNAFSVVWGSTIEVPNLENRLLFQKNSVEGSTDYVDNAVFALYNVGEDADENIYYIADDGTHIYLESDDVNPNVGKATVNGNSGTYEIYKDQFLTDENVDGYLDENNTGVITVTIGASEYTISPSQNAEGKTNVAYTHDKCDYVNQKGTGHFEKLSKGNYILREVMPPKGYQINAAEVMVKVDSTGVYANAGTVDDGVSVANGVGYLASTMDVSASKGVIDETLHWLYANLSVNKYNSFKVFPDKNMDMVLPNWEFVTKSPNSDALPGYGDGYSLRKSDPNLLTTYLRYNKHGVYGDDGGLDSEFLFSYSANPDRNKGENTLSLYTKEGWSSLVLYQDYDFGVANTAPETIYTDLRTAGRSTTGNILYLFSNSTFVVVTDKLFEDVTLLKVGDDEQQNPLANAGFTLTNEDGQYYSFDTAASSVVWKNTKTEVTTDADGVLRFVDLPEGEYTLTETTVPKATGLIYHPIKPQTLKVGRVKTNNDAPDNDDNPEYTYLTLTDYTPTRLKDGDRYYDNASDNFQYAVTIVDVSEIPKTELNIRKVGIKKADGGQEPPIPLDGAQFMLYKTDDQENKLYYKYDEAAEEVVSWGAQNNATTFTSDRNGRVIIEQIPDGTYFLEECTTPNGYSPLVSPVKIIVSDNTETISVESYDAEIVEEQDDTVTIQVNNYTGYVLPSTGGSGLLPYVFAGISIMAIPMVFIYRRGRLKRRRKI